MKRSASTPPPTPSLQDFANLREQRAYADALSLIATLRPVVDTFFDKVMVLDADPVDSRRQPRGSSTRFCATSPPSPTSARS